MNKTMPAPRCIIDKVTAVRQLNVLTINVHKGFTLFNRRFILPELREAVRATGADRCFSGSPRQSSAPRRATPRLAGDTAI